MKSGAESGERLREVYRAKARRDTSYLIEALRDSDFRDAAALALGELGDPAAIPPLIRLLNASDPHVRASAVRALGKLNAREAIDPLVEVACSARETWVVEWAMDSLGSIAGREAIATLVGLLNDPRPRVRRGAAIVLGRLGEPSVIEDIARARKRDHWFRRGRYREAERALAHGPGERDPATPGTEDRD